MSIQEEGGTIRSNLPRFARTLGSTLPTCAHSSLTNKADNACAHPARIVVRMYGVSRVVRMSGVDGSTYRWQFDSILHTLHKSLSVRHVPILWPMQPPSVAHRPHQTTGADAGQRRGRLCKQCSLLIKSGELRLTWADRQIWADQLIYSAGDKVADLQCGRHGS